MASTEDRDRSSVHEIRCRDRLWQTFEQMSEEQEKSVEELINDAMTGYAQIAGYETAVHAQTPAPTPPPLRGARPQPFIPPAPARIGRATTNQSPRVATGSAGTALERRSSPCHTSATTYPSVKRPVPRRGLESLVSATHSKSRQVTNRSRSFTV